MSEPGKFLSTDPRTPLPADLPRSRLRMSWWVRVNNLVLVLLGLAVGLFFYREQRAIRRLQETVAELDQTHPGWRLAEIEAAREEVPEDQNSALIIPVVAKLLSPSWPPETDEGDAFKVIFNKPLGPHADKQLEPALRAGRPAMRVARNLAQLPRGRFPVEYWRDSDKALLPYRIQTRRIFALLAYDVFDLLQTGDVQGAAQSCHAALNAARAIGDEPCMYSQFNRVWGDIVACRNIERLLAGAEPDSLSLAELQHAFDQEDGFDGLRVGLRGERAMGHETMHAIEAGDVPPYDLWKNIAPSWSNRLFPELTRRTIRELQSFFLSLLTKRIDAASRPLHDQEAADIDFIDTAHSCFSDWRYFRRFFGWSSGFTDAFRSQHSELRRAISALATERFRRAQGRWPRSLEELVPKYLAAVPLDPFDGSPLHLDRRPDGVMIYSFGRHRLPSGRVVNLNVPQEPCTDESLQLWDVAQRGGAMAAP